MINFIRYRGLSALFSLGIMVAFAGVCAYRIQTRGYAFRYGVDFTGGTQVLLKFSQPTTSSSIKSVLSAAGFDGVDVREFSGSSELLVRVKDFSNDANGLGDKMRQEILKATPEVNVEVMQSEGVGPGVGEELRWKSLQAILFAMIALFIYVAFRSFAVGFGAGAVVALFHDALVMFAAFLFMDREISVNLIGTVLAVLGYSVNDTIVIYSQIRKNLQKMAGSSIEEIVNISLNQTLRRTILTSFSTALAVISMLILGGEALRDFSLALMIGIIFGTYSSIYVASPVMMLFHKK